MSRDRTTRPDAALDAAIVLALTAATALLAVPATLARWWMTPDTVEHLATAHAWVSGAGFVDPVQWNYFRSSGVPFPSHALRAPAVSVLAAIPLAFGATVTTVQAAHAVFAAALAGGVYLVARRMMRRPAAVGAALVICWSPAYFLLARHVWNEATAIAVTLLVLATARAVGRAHGGAVLCGVLTLLAWLARPNLGALVAVVLAVAWLEVRAGRARRPATLATYLVTFVALYAGLSALSVALVGQGPYARYGFMAETFHADEALYYGKEWVGALAFVRTHAAEVGARIAIYARALATALVSADFHWLGWGLLPAVLHGLWSARAGVVERRSAALMTAGFALVAALTYTGFDPRRYPLFAFLGGGLCVMAMADELARRVARLVGRPWARGVARWLPLVAVALPLCAGTAQRNVGIAREAWAAYGRHGTVEYARRADRVARALCSNLDPDAIVAARDPWAVHLWCGNAALTLPRDLHDRAIRARFLGEVRPRYLLAEHPSALPDEDRPAFAWTVRAPELLAIAQVGQHILYEVVGQGAPAIPWRAPPPLACAGKGPACREALRRTPAPGEEAAIPARRR